VVSGQLADTGFVRIIQTHNADCLERS